jgi:hypothetical protein
VKCESASKDTEIMQNQARNKTHEIISEIAFQSKRVAFKFEKTQAQFSVSRTCSVIGQSSVLTLNLVQLVSKPMVVDLPWCVCVCVCVWVCVCVCVCV